MENADIRSVKIIEKIIGRITGEINTAKGAFILLSSMYSAVERMNDDCLNDKHYNTDMPAFLQSPQGKADFRDAVGRLVSDGLISPVGRKPNTSEGLYIKYRINRRQQAKDDTMATDIIKSIAPPASLDYYLKNPQNFSEDRRIIEIISNFLKKREMRGLVHNQMYNQMRGLKSNECHTDNGIVTVNERAYQLFGDEKFFKGDMMERSRGEIILKRLGLNYSDLCCVETAEPFFSFLKKEFHSSDSRDIFIIENKDTFWSFKRCLMDCPSSLKADMLIYGEGKKIISSFRFTEEYNIDPQKDMFFYFGDLDAEGVNIYCELSDAYPQYRILPFKKGYQAALEIGMRHEPAKTPKCQKINRKNIERFIGLFERPWAEKLRELLCGGFYIPQEALCAVEMKERFSGAEHG